MEIKSFIEKFAELLEVEGSNVITPATEYKEMDEWDSMMALSLLSMIADEYDVPIMGEDLKKANTVQQLFGIIVEKKQ